MRLPALLAATLLAACAPAAPRPVVLTPAEHAAWQQAQAEAAAQAAALDRLPPAERAAQVAAANREMHAAALRAQQAQAVCDARGQMAEATYPDRSLLRIDAVIAGRNARAACLTLYQRTGLLPPF